MTKPKLYLINGPLGAGKTTFLKQLLQLPEYHNARVIENEFASTSIDTQQLHDHQEEVKTIAGVCICCSTGDELTDALQSLARSTQPVIIEATGVANSLKLIEKIVVADMLDSYDVAHAIFVLDGAEAARDIPGTLSLYKHELEAADTVLVSKTDLLSSQLKDHLMNELNELSIQQLATINEGVFDYKLISQPSHILKYFSSFDGEVANHDGNSNYTIIDTEQIAFNVETINSFWSALQAKFGLRRMKGDIYDDQHILNHIEATPAQCRISPSSSSRSQLVFIGSDARSVSISVIQSEVSKNHA